MLYVGLMDWIEMGQFICFICLRSSKSTYGANVNRKIDAAVDMGRTTTYVTH